MKRKRVLVLSDFHSGHVLGLTHPSYDYTTGHKTQTAHYQVRRTIWNWYKENVVRLKPDIVIVNGDCIDGKGEKSGGTELLTLDRDEQCDNDQGAEVDCRSRFQNMFRWFRAQIFNELRHRYT